MKRDEMKVPNLATTKGKIKTKVVNLTTTKGKFKTKVTILQSTQNLFIAGWPRALAAAAAERLRLYPF